MSAIICEGCGHYRATEGEHACLRAKPIRERVARITEAHDAIAPLVTEPATKRLRERITAEAESALAALHQHDEDGVRLSLERIAGLCAGEPVVEHEAATA